MTISAVDARKRFGELLNRVSLGHEDILILRDGKPIARMVPLEAGNSQVTSQTISLRGLGKDVWKGVNPETYVASEREAW